MRCLGFVVMTLSLLLLATACGTSSDPAEDAGLEDAGLEDAGLEDAGLEDAGLEDAGPEDAGLEDAGLEDAGLEDAGLEDAGLEDAGLEDAGLEDAGLEDAGGQDGGDLPAVQMVEDGRYWHLGPMSYPGLLDRVVDVYLPVDYDSDPQARFPVLYMHDGQNLFDPMQAAFGVAWEVDETLDALTAAGHVPACIVVGVHNTAGRMEDYTPDVDPTYGGGAGDLYADFLAEVLKPVIDAHFRTQPGRETTAVMGSSLGGLISLHIFTRHPDVFGRVGAVSPSLWWNDGWAAWRIRVPCTTSRPGPIVCRAF